MAQNRLLKQVISHIVPANTLAHIEFCRVESGRLRITVDAAAWIAKIRFMERRIIDDVRAKGLDCHTVSFHVSVNERPIVRKTTRQANRTPMAAKSVSMASSLLALEENGKEDKLSVELEKLARHLRGTD